MVHLAKFTTRSVLLGALLTGLFTIPGAAHAGGLTLVSGTMKGGVDATYFPTVLIVGDGKATSFGTFAVETRHVYLSADASVPFFQGQLKITTADGSQLVASYLGMSDFSAVAEGRISDEVVAVVDGVRSSGRFARASGVLIVSSDSDLYAGRFSSRLAGTVWGR